MKSHTGKKNNYPVLFQVFNGCFDEDQSILSDNNAIIFFDHLIRKSNDYLSLFINSIPVLSIFISSSVCSYYKQSKFSASNTFGCFHFLNYKTTLSRKLGHILNWIVSC